jgi:hypothetical protein
MSKSWCFLARKTLTASEGGHTLRSHDLGMILARCGNGVCDCGHSGDVMKENEGRLASLQGCLLVAKSAIGCGTRPSPEILL